MEIKSRVLQQSLRFINQQQSRNITRCKEIKILTKRVWCRLEKKTRSSLNPITPIRSKQATTPLWVSLEKFLRCGALWFDWEIKRRKIETLILPFEHRKSIITKNGLKTKLASIWRTRVTLAWLILGWRERETVVIRFPLRVEVFFVW